MTRSRGAVLLSRAGLTQVEIASRLGVSRQLVSHWLPGHRVPSEIRRAAIEEALGIPRETWDMPWNARALIEDAVKRWPDAARALARTLDAIGL